MYKDSLRVTALSLMALVLAFGGSAFTAHIAQADTQSSDFESDTAGTSVNGQDGWSMTGPYDVEVANTADFGSPAGFGTKALRISNAVTSGAFGDQTFAKPLAQTVGEDEASTTTGTVSTHYEASFDIISAATSTQQSGLVLSVSPDDGQGDRMSYLRFEDQADGIHVFFDDVTDAGPLPMTATFNESDIATLDRGTSHHIKLTFDAVDGPANDIVQVFIDGSLVKQGTSWEDYYRYDGEQTGNGNVLHPVDTLLFRAGGTAAPGTDGKGFLVDNVSLTSGDSSFGTTDTAPSFTSTPVTTALVGQPYTYNITTAGTPGSISASGLPSGLSISDNGNGTAVISGTPTSAGTASITVSDVNGAGSSNQHYTLTTSIGDVYVSPTGSDTNDGTSDHPFATIAKAISTVGTGGTVHVLSGAYSENVDITKQLTLSGESGAEVDGQITVDAANASVTGLTVQNPNGHFGILINGVAGVSVTNDTVTHIGDGTPNATENSYGIYFQSHTSGSTSGITISDNTVSNVGGAANPTKSNGGVGVGDSTGTATITGLVVDGNTISNVSSTNKGAYGIIVNYGGSTSNAEVKDNTISSLSGGWAHGIGLEGATPDATVTGNILSNITATGLDAAAVHFDTNADSASVTLQRNSFDTTSVTYGVTSSVATDVDATKNYWNNGATDPSDKVATVGGAITVSPWLCTSDLNGDTSDQNNCVATPTANTVTVTPSDTQGWSESSASDGSATIVADSSHTGAGALELITSSSTDSVTHYTLATDFAMDTVSKLTYDTKVVSAADTVNGNATLRINVNLSGTGSTTDDQLMFEPYYNGFSGNTDWSTWTITQSSGNLWSNNNMTYNGKGGVSAGSYASNFTLADVLHDYPNAKIVGVVASMGTWNVSQDVLVDDVRLKTYTDDTTYNFEQDAPANTSTGGGHHSSFHGSGGAGFTGTVGGSVGGGQVLGAATYHFTMNLTIGSTGADVTALQQILIDAGYLHIAAPTGYFGPLTQAALAEWQAAHGITPAVGYFGPITMAAMNAGTVETLTEAEKANILLQLLDILKQIQAIQDALNKLK